jgi:hypothetical protein
MVFGGRQNHAILARPQRREASGVGSVAPRPQRKF